MTAVFKKEMELFYKQIKSIFNCNLLCAKQIEKAIFDKDQFTIFEMSVCTEWGELQTVRVAPRMRLISSPRFVNII